VRLLAAAMLGLAAPAFAQYAGPAVEACAAYALQDMRRNGASVSDAVIERDRHLLLERRRGKAGSQPIAAVLTGNGAAVYPGTPSAELSFVCLLADEKRPVFFAWLPRRDGSARAQCMRDAALRASARPCLDALLSVADIDLGALYGQRREEAAARGEAALAAFRKSNDAWREYRDAECARRGGDEEERLGCVIELTRRRLLDLE